MGNALIWIVVPAAFMLGAAIFYRWYISRRYGIDPDDEDHTTDIWF